MPGRSLGFLAFKSNNDDSDEDQLATIQQSREQGPSKLITNARQPQGHLPRVTLPPSPPLYWPGNGTTDHPFLCTSSPTSSISNQISFLSNQFPQTDGSNYPAPTSRYSINYVSSSSSLSSPAMYSTPPTPVSQSSDERRGEYLGLNDDDSSANTGLNGTANVIDFLTHRPRSAMVSCTPRPSHT